MSKIITQTEFAELLRTHKGASAVSITTETEPKMRKTNNPYFGRVKRIARRSGMLGASYENAVNRQREREGIASEFKAESLWGGAGEPVGGSLVRHKTNGGLYAVFFPTYTDEQGKPIASDDCWTLDNIRVGDGDPKLTEIKSFLSGSSESPKQGVEKAIAWRVVKLENVCELRYKGEVYTIR